MALYHSQRRRHAINVVTMYKIPHLNFTLPIQGAVKRQRVLSHARVVVIGFGSDLKDLKFYTNIK